MLSLTEEDLDRLTSTENQLIRMRKREAANNNTLCYDISGVIYNIHLLRQMLQGRFNMNMDDDIER